MWARGSQGYALWNVHFMQLAMTTLSTAGHGDVNNLALFKHCMEDNVTTPSASDHNMSPAWTATASAHMTSLHWHLCALYKAACGSLFVLTLAWSC